MQIDRDLIEHLGELARIHLPGERLADLRAQLQQLVDAFSTLAAADLGSGDADGPAPARPALTPATLRPDAPEPVSAPEQVLANAPQRAADCFVVPRVVEP